MRKFISIFMILMLIVTITMSGVSHAISHDSTKDVKIESAAPGSKIAINHDCDHHDHVKADTHNNHDMGKKSCCDDGLCKCPDGACHSGIVKISVATSYSSLNLASISTHFEIINESCNSASLDRIKRPPKA